MYQRSAGLQSRCQVSIDATQEAATASAGLIITQDSYVLDPAAQLDVPRISAAITKHQYAAEKAHLTVKACLFAGDPAASYYGQRRHNHRDCELRLQLLLSLTSLEAV